MVWYPYLEALVKLLWILFAFKMTGNKCAAYSCDNNYYSSHKNRKNHIFHSFPKGKDLASQTLREKWVKFCRRVDKFNPNTSRICSDHFVNSDYERDLQNELLGKLI